MGEVEIGDSFVTAPTPFETAFEKQLYTRFDAILQEPYINYQGRMVRLSSPFWHQDKEVIARYLRFDVLRHASEYDDADMDHVVQGLLAHNPRIRRQLGVYPHISETAPETERLRAQRERKDYQNLFTAQMERQIIERDGSFSVMKPLTDRAFYSEKRPIKSFPEGVEFVVYEQEESDNFFPGEIDSNGYINGVAPQVYGRLYLPAGFLTRPLSEQRTNLSIKRPNSGLQVARAFLKSYAGYPRSWEPGSDAYAELEFDKDPPIEVPFPTTVSPRVMARNILNFISEICAPAPSP